MTRDASRTRRTLPAIATLTIAAASMAGCSWMSPVQTMKTYAPADGVEADLGSLKVTNLLVVTDKEGAEGTVVGSVTNSSNDEQTISFGEGPAEKVPAGGVLNLQQSGLTVPAVKAPPGAMTQMTLTSPQSGSVAVQVPVLARQGIYATVTPAAGEATASATETPAASDTAAPSESQSVQPSASQTSGTVAPPPAGTDGKQATVPAAPTSTN